MKKSNELIHAHYFPTEVESIPRQYPGKHCQFFDTKILKTMNTLWKGEYKKTMSRHLEHKHDISVPFLHAHTSILEGRAEISMGNVYYSGTWGDDRKTNEKIWSDIERQSPHCAVINMGMSETSEGHLERGFLLKKLCKMFPSKSAFEVGEKYDPCSPTGRHLDYARPPRAFSSPYCKNVDIVYTWVNGSDPEHFKELSKFKKFHPNDARRFRDCGTLQFSVRSIELFAPWARNIIFVTNGQVPSWLDLTNPRVRIVTHAQIFSNQTHLPTFSSNAIEASLHNIPDTECFLYLNDDFFLGRPIDVNFYVNQETGRLNLYMDGYVAPEKERMKHNLWHRSVGKSNELLNSYYYPGKPDTKHNYAGHHCYFMDKTILQIIAERWKDEFDRTAERKFRSDNDLAIPFLHANTALEEFGAQKYFKKFGYAMYLIISLSFFSLLIFFFKIVLLIYYFHRMTLNHTKNVEAFEKLENDPPPCICIQDELDISPQVDKEVDFMINSFCKRFPKPSSFEKPGYDPCKGYTGPVLPISSPATVPEKSVKVDRAYPLPPYGAVLHEPSEDNVAILKSRERRSLVGNKAPFVPPYCKVHLLFFSLLFNVGTGN